jgi:hypothetical protein
MEYAKLYRFISNCSMPFAKVKDFFFSYKWLKRSLYKHTACTVEVHFIPIAIGSMIFTGLNSSSVCMLCQLRHP